MRGPPVIATLFDFDGVLVDSEPVHLAAFNDVLAPHGVVIDERTYVERYLSLDDAGVFRSALDGREPPVDDRAVRELVAAKSPRFLARFAGAFRAFAGAADIVRRRAQRGPVAIVSGALALEIEFALDLLGLTSAVAFIVSAESTAASKPDPAPYLHAVAELRARGHAGRAVVIEDSLGGIQSAKRAGLGCAAVAHSYPAEALREAGADVVALDLAAMTDDLLDRLADLPRGAPAEPGR
jgi:beta-phosphoglucomutase